MAKHNTASIFRMTNRLSRATIIPALYETTNRPNFKPTISTPQSGLNSYIHLLLIRCWSDPFFLQRFAHCSNYSRTMAVENTVCPERHEFVYFI